MPLQESNGSVEQNVRVRLMPCDGIVSSKFELIGVRVMPNVESVLASVVWSRAVTSTGLLPNETMMLSDGIVVSWLQLPGMRVVETLGRPLYVTDSGSNAERD